MASEEVSVLAADRQQALLDSSITQPNQDLGLHGAVSEQRIVVGPHRRGLGLLCLAILLLGAWGGIVPYIGPRFGYRANASGSFQWSAAHTLLYLIPGAVAMGWALVILLALMVRGRGLPVVKAIAALTIVAAGAWFVLGPEVWPVFSSSVVFGPATGPLARLVNQIGYNFGLGVLLAVLGAVLLARPATDRYVIRSTSARPATTSSQ
jgi:hypothetical protein